MSTLNLYDDSDFFERWKSHAVLSPNKCTEYLKQHITQCLSNEFINPFYNPVAWRAGHGKIRAGANNGTMIAS